MKANDDCGMREAQRLDSLCVLKQACDNFLETARIVEGGGDVLTFHLEMPQIREDYFYLRAEITSHDKPIESSRAAKAFINGIKLVLHRDPLSSLVVRLPEDTQTTRYLVGHSPNGDYLPEKIEEIYKAHDHYVVCAINQKIILKKGAMDADDITLIKLLPKHANSLSDIIKVRFCFGDTIARSVDLLKSALHLAKSEVLAVPHEEDHALIWRLICYDSGVVIPSVLSKEDAGSICSAHRKTPSGETPLAPH